MVIGYGGAFPPYERLKRGILNVRNFRDAFKLGLFEFGHHGD
jgi:hypothetical protein